MKYKSQLKSWVFSVCHTNTKAVLQQPNPGLSCSEFGSDFRSRFTFADGFSSGVSAFSPMIPSFFAASCFICQSHIMGSRVIRSVWSWNENIPPILSMYTSAHVCVCVVFCFLFRHTPSISRMLGDGGLNLGCLLQGASHKTAAFTCFEFSFAFFSPNFQHLSELLLWAQTCHISYYQ